jgi:hypothetical protein
VSASSLLARGRPPGSRRSDGVAERTQARSSLAFGCGNGWSKSVL